MIAWLLKCVLMAAAVACLVGASAAGFGLGVVVSVLAIALVAGAMMGDRYDARAARRRRARRRW